MELIGEAVVAAARLILSGDAELGRIAALSLAVSGTATLLVQGDPALFNVYHVMPVNPQKFPNVKINAAGGAAFANWLVAPDTQKVIGDFGRDRFGQALFIPDAGKQEGQLGG